MTFTINDIENIRKMRSSFSDEKIKKILAKQDKLNLSDSLRSTLQKIRHNGGKFDDLNKKEKKSKEIIVDLPDKPFINLNGGGDETNTDSQHEDVTINPAMPFPVLPKDNYQQYPMIPPQLPPNMYPYQQYHQDEI